MKCLLIGLFGGLGSLARYLAASAVATKVGSRFPRGTLAVNVNVSGCS
jgi:fluoride ion exporter CrcB/FEX